MSNHVYVMLGFDCDRPRGELLSTLAGQQMAETKVRTLERLAKKMDYLETNRTYFICGHFLESIAGCFSTDDIRSVFLSSPRYCEIGDHTYSHNILKPIPTRPDKAAIPPQQVIKEYRINNILFRQILGISETKRGLRAPLGHFSGLKGQHKLLYLLHKEGISYVSSDLRDANHSINPPLVNSDGTIRQPYLYKEGLLEIPAHGWHDTAFMNQTRTPLFEQPPQSFKEIVSFYHSLIREAVLQSQTLDRELYLGLVLHPLNMSLYDPRNEIIERLLDICCQFNTKIITYSAAAGRTKVQNEEAQ